jgi:hypothetical protein
LPSPVKPQPAYRSLHPGHDHKRDRAGILDFKPGVLDLKKPRHILNQSTDGTPVQHIYLGLQVDPDTAG